MSQFLVSETTFEGQQDTNPHVGVGGGQQSLVLVRLIDGRQFIFILGLGWDVRFVDAAEPQPGDDPHMFIRYGPGATLALFERLTELVKVFLPYLVDERLRSEERR